MRNWGAVAGILLAAGTPTAAFAAGKPTLGKQTYVALTEGGDVRSTAALLRDSINSLGGTCSSVDEYQLFQQTVTVSTMKVVCAGRSAYLLSVDSDGGMLVDGGDGRVAAMDAADGVIVEVPAAGAADPGDAVVEPQARTPVRVEMRVAPLPAEPPQGWTRWLFALLALLVAIVAFTIYRGFTRPEVVAIGPQPYRRYTTETKDRLVAESREIGPYFWRHPSGLYIVRGRNGKRRVFPRWTWAQVYRIWGIKIAQLR